MLGAALAAGFCSARVDVTVLGVVPTGLVSFAACAGAFGMGAVVSASHNPAPDNGVKLIGHDGRKLSDAVEAEIESLLEAPGERPEGAMVGWMDRDPQAIVGYMQHLEALVPERLDGMRVAVDCAHGAAFELGPEVLRRLGAEVVACGVEPDGMNINAHGGATKPAAIQELTRSTGAVIGIAFDGDADRAVFSDSQGRLINGDRTMAIWARHWRSGLHPPALVGTVMSNGGFESYLRQAGVSLVRTPVGDKHVAARMAETGAKLGGEQSGHLIFAERGPTGDGLVTALELLRVLRREGRTAAEAFGEYEAWPQLLVNVKVADRETWDRGERVATALAEAAAKLNGHGRLVVRASGTQPMIRIMVEADEVSLRDAVARGIVKAIQAEAGGEVYGEVDLTHALGD
jgi:phosphoglucosamine mutase